MRRILLVLVVIASCWTLNASLIRGPGPEAGAHAFTWDQEFDYLSWVADAFALKLGMGSLGLERYMDESAQSDLVGDSMALVADIQKSEGELARLYADPDPAAVQAQIEQLTAHLEQQYQQRAHMAPLAESILQEQVAAVFAEQGFTLGGQTVPPILFHSTPLPWALIVSPRDHIAQMDNISLRTELTLPEHIAIEDEVGQALDVSTLVVPVGGIGLYPTMVAQTSDLNWLVQTIAHEWAHNYLTLRPLGISYYNSQDLTTMNETTANIVGKEIGAAVIARYYPERVPPPADPQPTAESSPAPAEPPAFDFRAEMHTTRVTVDELLAQSQIDEAEAYMEQQRLRFWDHGYAIRKLNQAYFAFYGSYADVPGGAAGEDPVGAAVRQLRGESSTLIQFVQRIAWLTSFADLRSQLTAVESQN